MGTTAEKLTYLNETKTQLKDMLNLGGASLTTEPFRQYVDTLKNRYLYFINNGTQEVWDNWEKVVGEGTTITLNNTEEAPMKIVLKGNTSQEGTPTPETPQDIHVVSGDNSIVVCGVNLLQKQGYGTPYSDSTYWLGSPNWLTSGDDGWATFSVDNSSSSSVAYKNMMIKGGNVNYLPSTDYTIFVELKDLSIDSATGDMIYLSQGTNTQDPFNSGQIKITYGEATNKVYRFSATTKANLTDTLAFRTFAVVPAGKNVSYKIRAMIVEGNYEKNIYEPYQSASYPINLGELELCKIGDYQDKIDKSSGKNLVETIDIYNGYPVKSIGSVISYNASANSITYMKCAYVNANKTYTLSWNYATPKATGNRDIIICDDNKIELEYFAYSNVNNKSYTFTPTYNGWIYASLDTNAIEVMLNEGTTALEYEPYGTGWYVKKEIGKHTITDSDISLISSYWYNTYGQYGAGILKSNLGLPETSTNRQSLCNMSKKIDGQSYINNNTYIFNANANYVFFFSSDFDTKEHANEKLVGANVYFNLDTPTSTEITDSTLLSQLNALAKSYNSQTNISQNNNDLPFIINATALREMA